MALFNVPQYIDVEDKVAGPLTVKQLGWMLFMFAILAILWMSLPNKVLFAFAAIPTVLVFVSLAFVKLYGQTMISLVMASFNFFLKPKVYVWKRVSKKVKVDFKGKQMESKNFMAAKQHEDERQRMLSNLSGLAKIVDSGGAVASADTISMLKKPSTKK